jgi:hypothetical protein
VRQLLLLERAVPVFKTHKQSPTLTLHRREFLKLSGLAALAPGLGGFMALFKYA